MTLIVTVFNRFGIVNASDSNVVAGPAQLVKEGRKTFEIPGLHAAMTIAGTRSIGDTPAESYFDLFLREHNHTSLGDFAHDLHDQLKVDLLPHELQRLILIQIGGYSNHADGWHPELWFIRNAAINSVTGDYEPLPDLMLTEDFWASDCPQFQLLYKFELVKSRYYFNGFPAGRIGFRALVPRMDEFFDGIWSQPSWKFRPPGNLDETAVLVTHYMRTIAILFQLSNYEAEYIGGQVQSFLVPVPGKLAPQPTSIENRLGAG